MGKISNYTRVLVAKLQDVFVVDQTDNNVTTTKSVTVEQIGDTIAGTQVHSDLKTDSQTIIGGINELAKDKNVADEYDDTHTYNTGDITIYGNTLYICTANNTTGDFDPSKWTATTIDNVIGTLSTLTTTDKSSIVGAVNEVNTVTDITSDYITMASGYTFTSGKVYKQGKHIFGNIVLSGTLQGGNNTDTLGTIKSDYRPSDPINGFCGISNGQWFTNNIGYVYIASSGGLQVATTPNGMSYAKIHIDYVTA